MEVWRLRDAGQALFKASIFDNMLEFCIFIPHLVHGQLGRGLRPTIGQAPFGLQIEECSKDLATVGQATGLLQRSARRGPAPVETQEQRKEMGLDQRGGGGEGGCGRV